MSTSPPTFYIPAADVRTDLLEAAEGSSHCESPDLVGPFKGEPGSHGW